MLGSKKALKIWTSDPLIRAAKTPREAHEGLIAAFEFTERQAQAIIELQLQRLTGMEQQKIIDELAESRAGSRNTSRSWVRKRCCAASW